MSVQFTVVKEGIEYCFDWTVNQIIVPDVHDGIGPGIWEAIQDAEASDIGIAEPEIAFAEGRTALTRNPDNSVKSATFLTVRLQGDWQVYTQKSSGRFTSEDFNLVRQDGGEPFADNPLVTVTNIISQAGVEVSPDIPAAPTPAENAAAVWEYTRP